MDCCLPDSSVRGILQARILEWVVIYSPGDLPDPGIKPKSSALQADSLPTELMYGFCPWSGKIPHVTEQLGLHATTVEACTPRACIPQQEIPWQ